MSSLAGLLSLSKKDKVFKELLEALGTPRVSLSTSVNEPLRPFLISSLHKELDRAFLVITPTLEKAERFKEDARNFLPASHIYLFPDLEIFPTEGVPSNRSEVAERVRVLHKLKTQENILVILSVQAALCRFAPVDVSYRKPIKILKKKEIEFLKLVSSLAKRGYTRVPMVETKGDFSVRGGIIDIFPATETYPVRVEFFGDSAESIRRFNLANQRSFESLNEVFIFSCREGVSNKNAKKSIFDYLSSQSLIVFDGLKEVLDEAEKFYRQEVSYLNEVTSLQEIPKPSKSYFLKPSRLSVLPFSRLDLISLKAKTPLPTIYDFESFPPTEVAFELERLKKMLREFLAKGYALLVVLRSDGQLERMKEILDEWNINSYYFKKKADLTFKKVGLARGDLSRGFIYSELKLGVLSETDIFFRRKFRELTRTKGAPFPIKISDFKKGDYVVHSDFGIAKYEGLAQEVISGSVWDLVVLKYADGKLKVRVDQAVKVGKYIGQDTSLPKLSYLSKRGRWLKTKSRAKSGAKKLVIDLLKLYAKRTQAEGFAYSTDSNWQRELEDSFSFTETEDQLKAVAEIKEDMEAPRPMDRLILGDVGYGKTEVAVRAAFKAAVDDKQVMVLVPTTILAEQHFATFSQRLAPFPVFVEVLSRFRPRLQQKRILDSFRSGKIDILIGTHRLLQKDVFPYSLGLVVVDEEQRFGVAHKEYLRNLKESVDVLTLSATPIPRTLQMSLSGIRDLSVIDTPPEDRYPVTTYVGECDFNLVKVAIRREFSRGGQVYYLHNRVETIDKAAGKIKDLVPEARVAIAHGRMSEQELSTVMSDFLAGKYDILVCTTIIESGIDIPNANTIIVAESERFGLAQLYQLRGRVGRSDRRSYAYFFFTEAKALGMKAYDRLKTIGEFTELGSGFKIALRDLEIRGAGNLLGPEQHGYLSQVGFELYLELLREAASELQGKPKERKEEVKVDLPISAYIPSDYIDDEALRIAAYQDIASIGSLKKAKEASLALKDRYGPLPNPAKSLIDVCALKVLARKARVKSISVKGGELELLLSSAFSCHLVNLLKEKYPSLIYRPQYRTIVMKAPYQRIVFFLKKFFDDIIGRKSLAKKKKAS